MRTVRKPEIPQQNAHFVTETIRQTTKDASTIATSSETEIPTETPGHRNQSTHDKNLSQPPYP